MSDSAEVESDSGDRMQRTERSIRVKNASPFYHSTSSPMVEEEEEFDDASQSAASMVLTSPVVGRDSSDDDDDVSEVPLATYLPDTRVFAKDEHGGFYEAVVRKPNFVNGQWKYLVHYQGWNSRWDRWLDESQLVPDSDEARRHAQLWQQEQNAKEQQRAATKKEKRKPSGGDRKRRKTADDMSASSSVPPRSKRRGTAAATDPDLLSLFEDACELPFTLKTILVEDQERVIRKGFDTLYNGYDHNMEVGKKWRPARDVHHLPAAVPIRTVLNHYVKIKKKEAPDDKAAAAEDKARRFVDGLATLFDEALPVCLLFETERAQHQAVEAESSPLKGVRRVDMYGCEHLLRLFVRLPQILSQAPPSDVKPTAKQLSDLIVLLQKNRLACFRAKYREPKQEELNDWERRLRDKTNIVDMDGS